MLSDLDIGMNDWVVPRFTWDDSYRPDRGRVLDAGDLERITKFLRYTNEDEDYVAARTLPGVDSKGAFFTRGSGHTKLGGYTETPDEYQEVMDRLLLKHKAAAKYIPAPVVRRRAGARIGIVTVGGCEPAVLEALDILSRRGIEADYMRLRGFPFDESVEAFLDEHDTIFVIEQNRDAQLRSLLTLETPVPKEKLRSVLVYGGFPLSAKHVIDGLAGQLEASEQETAEPSSVISRK
jgi:2-oxoglutarate ferredoxin oxidoreductase subunit alpha